MLELFETIAGGVVMAVYLAVSVVLPSAVIAAFVLLAASLLRIGIDMPLRRLADVAALRFLRVPGVITRSAVTSAAGFAIFLALVGLGSGELGSAMLVVGFTRAVEALVSLQDIVAQAFTGRGLTDMLVETQSGALLSSLRLFETMTATHVHQTLRPAITLLAFRWTFAAFADALFVFYVLLEPLRAIRRRVAHGIETVGVPAPERVAAARVAVAGGTAAAAEAPAEPAPAPGRLIAMPRRQPRTVESAPDDQVPDDRSAMDEAALPSAEAAGAQVMLVTRDPALVEAIRQRLEILGYAAPTVVRSVAQALAAAASPSLLLVDAGYLPWVNVDHVPLVARLRMVAITRRGVELPDDWHLDTYALDSGVHGLLELLRARLARRRVPSES